MKATEEFDILAIFQALFPQQRISQGKAVCPFHSERTASLHFFKGTDGKPRYHCFGCGVKGDVLDLIQASAQLDGEELSLVQTIQRLEELTGKKLLSAKAQEAYAARKLQQERMQKVYRFLNRQLVAQPAGRKVREWLVERGIPPETWERLPIGVYPIWEEIKPWAKEENIPYEWLKEERLLIGAEKGGERWTGAIAFFYGQSFNEFSRIKLRPVHGKASEAQFLGKKEADIGFFGLSHYQPHNGDRPLFVEGEFDMLVPWALAIRDHGQVPNIFCRSGSAGKTLDAMMALKDLGMGSPILLGDNDKAGGDWGAELSRHCRQSGMDASISLPLGYQPNEDPAELANRLGSIEAFEKAVIEGIKDPFALQEESSCPRLPEYARIPEEVGKDACPWLDAYVEFSRKWSPRSYDLYHEACGLWVLSTVAARRVVTTLGKKCYTSLYLLMIGETTEWRKTTATDIARDLLINTGLDFLLAPEKSTPEGLIMRMKGVIPDNYCEIEDRDLREAVKSKLALSGRIGWYYEEFGGHLEEMLKPNGFMSQFRSMLRVLDECPPKYEYMTRSYGEEVINSPYLALIGSLTPSDFKLVEKQSRILWGDGYFARYAMIVAPQGENPHRKERFPEGEKTFPLTLQAPLRRWHDRLKVPEINMIPIKDGRGRETGKYTAELGISEETIVQVSKEARDCFDRYDDALSDISGEIKEKDRVLKATYSRLSNRALRISLLFASLAGEKEIKKCHWARAQEICERQRASLHFLLNQILGGEEVGRYQKLEEKIREIGLRIGNPSIREIHQRIPWASTQEIQFCVDSLIRSGEVEKVDASSSRGRKTFRYDFQLS